MQIIDGKKIAEEILARLKSLPEQDKFFGAVLVGDDSASVNFLKQKAKVAESLEVEFRLYNLSVEMKTDDLRREIGRLSAPKNCGGFIVQLPLPEGVNRHYVLNAIPKEKDLDLLGESALGAFYTGRHIIAPPSVGAVEEILARSKLNLRESSVVMMGAGFLIGRPVGFWLQDKVAELTMIDKNAKHLRAKLRDADIVISGAGVPGLFSTEDLKDGALVIDFGFNKLNGKIVGDFRPGEPPTGSHEQIAAFYTPTPGGTGPILVAKLFENFYTLNDARKKI